tara:strand:+ start:798 stop:1661 length:864 start_codon:yes stop_codon:yes gene_type:complete
MNNLRFLKNEISVSDLFNKVGIKKNSLTEDLNLKSISSFSNKGNDENLQFTIAVLNEEPSGITFAPYESAEYQNVIRVEEPKNIFFKIVIWLEKHIGFKPLHGTHIANTANVHETAVISSDVQIGEGTTIGAGVVLYPNVKIGNNCIIEANTVIGNAGFGVIREQSENLMIPHIGGVLVGDNVRIGALTTIDRGTIGITRIGNFTKIDDRVHIAHNCNIGTQNIICAGTCIAGSVTVGDGCWLGLGCNVRQKIHIDHNSNIGIGANIFHDTNNQLNMLGYPAKKLPR